MTIFGKISYEIRAEHLVTIKASLDFSEICEQHTVVYYM